MKNIIKTPLLWVAVDICKALGHSNPTALLKDFNDDEKGLTLIKTSVGAKVTIGRTFSLSFSISKSEPGESHLGTNLSSNDC